MTYKKITNFIKLLKKGLKTDLNFKRFPKFSNRISGSSSRDNESKIQNHCFIFWFPGDLNSRTYALGNSILISFNPFKNFGRMDGKIAVFAFNPVNDACYFFFRWMVLRFLKTEASVRMGLKAVCLLKCCSVRFTLSDAP